MKQKYLEKSGKRSNFVREKSGKWQISAWTQAFTIQYNTIQ